MHSTTPSATHSHGAPQPLLVAFSRPNLTPGSRLVAIALCPSLRAEQALPPIEEAVAGARQSGAVVHLFSAGQPWPGPGPTAAHLAGIADAAGIVPRHLHTVPAAAADPLAAARAYERELRAFFCLSDGALPRFDLVLLGSRRLLDALGEEPLDRLVVATFDSVRRRQAVALTLPALLGATPPHPVTETENR